MVEKFEVFNLIFWMLVLFIQLENRRGFSLSLGVGFVEFEVFLRQFSGDIEELFVQVWSLEERFGLGI